MWVLVFQTSPSWDGPEYDAHGWRLAQGLGYVLDDGTPTAFWPVGYPAFLAVIYLIFGHSWLAAGIANAALGTISAALTYRLARETLSSRFALLAAGLVAFFPSHIISATPNLMTEALHTVFVLATLIAACHLARRPTWTNAALLGLLLGVGLYARPILLFFPVVVASLIMIRGVEIRKSVGLASVTLLVSLLTILPWTIRNYLVMGEPILTATNGGITFYMANGPGATGRQRTVHIEDTFSDSSEIAVYRESVRLGLEHILDHPVEWLELMPTKFFYLWAGDTWNIVPGAFSERHRHLVPVLRVIAQGYWTIVVIGAAVAAIGRPLFGYWLRFPAVLLPLTLLGWSAFHVMFHGGSRFHSQMIPVVAIVAAHLLAPGFDWRAWLPEKWRGSRASLKM